MYVSSFFLIWEMWKGAELETAVRYREMVQQLKRRSLTCPQDQTYISSGPSVSSVGCGESELRSIDLPE